MAAIIPVFVPHAGCPCRCVFCNQRAIAGQTQPMTPECAERILRDGVARLKPGIRPQAAFYGGSFTAIPVGQQEALLGVTDRLRAERMLDSVRCSTRPDAIAEPTLQRLRAHGVTTIELGAQSMDDGVLRKSGRGHTASDTVHASGLVRRAGMELILQMMVGLPGDMRATVRATANAIARLRPDGVRIYPVVVLPQTELYQQWKAGTYHALEPEEAAEWCADALECFEHAGIPVIRVGLNPSEELCRQVVAGAYHPAMGELAYGALWYRRLRERILQGESGRLEVPKRELSRAIGQNRRNVLRLRAEFPHKRIEIKPCADNAQQVETTQKFKK